MRIWKNNTGPEWMFWEKPEETAHKTQKEAFPAPPDRHLPSLLGALGAGRGSKRTDGQEWLKYLFVNTCLICYV